MKVRTTINRAGAGFPAGNANRAAAVSEAHGSPITRHEPHFKLPPYANDSTIQRFNDLTSRREAGIALVVTLILLAVITFMAITFLVVSTTDRGNSSETLEQRVAREAAEIALQQANAQIMANMLAFTNPTLGLMVSTNYDTHAFISGNTALTNTSYTYANGAPLNAADKLQNLNNLYYLPRAPVYITNAYGSNYVPFYFDANRNGRFETNGWQPLINPNGGYYALDGTFTTVFNPTNVLMANLVGDPEWVGVLERGCFSPARLDGTDLSPFPLGFGHSPTNRFTSRYAFLVIPISSTLDINSIHNYARQLRPSMTGNDCFLRNQGAGTWELNLAAFLTDLNTNLWPFPAGNAFGTAYNYDPFSATGNTGSAFDDALAVLRYRYNQNWNGSLYSVASLFGPNGVSAFSADYIDGYTGGPVMTGLWWTPPSDRDTPARTRLGWWGSDNTNHLWDTQDWFDPAKTKVGITAGLGLPDRLNIASTNIDTYDRYTFYRLLSQMGFDSAPEAPKLNLNYVNVDANGKIIPNLATNFTPWEPAQFFTNAIVHLLTNTFTESNPTNPYYITNFVVNGHLQIQVYPTNHYAPSVHRLLQLAANIYDASTNRTFNQTFPTNMPASGFPSVFMPVFSNAYAAGRGGKGIYITGYLEVTNLDLINRPPPFYDLEDPAFVPPSQSSGFLVYGIPFVVGAKKGYPNFNEFALQSDLIVSRKLEFHRDTPGGDIVRTNQTYNLGISNSFGVEAWNSYGSAFTRSLDLIAASDVICSVTNTNGFIKAFNGAPLSGTYSIGTVTNVLNWPAYNQGQKVSFFAPISTNYLFLTNSDYAFNQNQFLRAGLIPNDPPNIYPIPQWSVNLRSRLRVIMVDRAANRIIDYVNLARTEPTINLAEHLNHNESGAPADCTGLFSGIGSIFCTNRLQNSIDPRVITYGIQNQIMVSRGLYSVDDRYWADYQKAQNKAAEAAIFNARMGHIGPESATMDFAAPFTPRQVVHRNVSWQVNDPLVHYVVQDLIDLMGASKPVTYGIDPTGPFTDFAGAKVGGSSVQVDPLNAHYRPWGGRPGSSGDTAPSTKKNWNVKDPFVSRSDDWQFVTNKFPDLGWIGRVHRGTPWQTIYLKPPGADPVAASQTWAKWSGHIITNWYSTNFTLLDYVYSDPTNDYRVLDLFTTAFNDNASRGQLSVNQTNLAAWSAALAGCIVNTNAGTNSFSFIQPAGTFNALDTNAYPALVKIVAGINRTRAAQPGGRFARLGDILRTPELTTASPYIVTNNNAVVNDAVYERIPQQILSLLRNDEPRYVIYAFGQALKPAPNSIITAIGANFNLCTNYQITAETAARAVVHLEGPPENPHIVVDSYNILGPY